jgi:CDP-glycerol glycerophosphotransferase (TagB/SpsB family)/glycosyltransferase involved in cell wall biosynthesis
MTDRTFQFGAVIATYNVARYLPAFLDSLAAQTYSIDQVQLVFVDDGSTDGSGDVLEAWVQGRESHVTLIRQSNAWVADARNAGLEHLDSEWVTFTDPDDVLDRRYFEKVADFLRYKNRPDLALLAAHQMKLLESGELQDTHAHRRKFDRGSRIANLLVEPIFQLSVNSAFVKTALLRSSGVRFDGRVRPHFEDGHFLAQFLLKTKTHLLGLMASAKYHYRTRGDGTSLLETSFTHPGKYTSILRFGYLDLLETAAAIGPVPRWLENAIVYDLVWYFKEQLAVHSLSASAPPEVLDEFHDLVAQIVRRITPDAIRSFDFVGVDHSIRQALLRGYQEESVRPDYVRVSDVDEPRRLVKFEYWFSGELPHEEYRVSDVPMAPVHETIQDFVFYRRPVIRRRIVWLPLSSLTTVTIDGVAKSIVRWEQYEQPKGLTNRLLQPLLRERRRAVRRRFTATNDTLRAWVRRGIADWRNRNRPSKSGFFEWRLSFALRLASVRKKYADAWVFMDKNNHANDNAEHLFRYVAQNHPEIKSWFVLAKNSDDWPRLKAEGFRLVEYKSFQWFLLLLHARHFASSHADYYVTHPLDRRRFGQPRYDFTFLQHGVINYDLSRWLNGKPIDLLVTTTESEYEAIAGPGDYPFSSHEVMLTGLPRHDALASKSAARKEKDLIVILPTWRQSLVGDRVDGGNERARTSGFAESLYAVNWSSVIASEALRNLARDTGKTLAFMPHPHMRPYLDDFNVPNDVQLFDFSTDDVQDVLARAAAFVTDYSSLAFDAAFIDVPVVYYHFDYESYFSGTQPGRKGYFDYERDGFGPVVGHRAALESALFEIGSRGYRSSAAYAERVGATFVTRDGRSSERVVEAMRSLEGRTVFTSPVAKGNLVASSATSSFDLDTGTNFLDIVTAED